MFYLNLHLATKFECHKLLKFRTYKKTYNQMVM